jgi:hypothetical protein
MDFNDAVDNERWEELQRSLDELFRKVSAIDANQSQLKEHLDLQSKVVDQTVRDQILISKQLVESGRAITQLRMDKAKEPAFDADSSPRSTTEPKGNKFTSNRPHFIDENPWGTMGNTHKSRDTSFSHVPKSAIPKMPFPTFDGSHPRIWIDKVVNYFTIYQIPHCLWVTAATVAFDDNASKWLQVYKLQHELGTWDDFTSAVLKQFGTYDYKHAMDDIMTLRQTGSVQEFYQEFTDAKYQLHMHNAALDDTFFVQQFIRGLKQCYPKRPKRPV